MRLKLVELDFNDIMDSIDCDIASNPADALIFFEAKLINQELTNNHLVLHLVLQLNI